MIKILSAVSIRYFAIIVLMAVFSALLQTLSFSFVLPCAILTFLTALYLVFKPTKIGRAIAIPFFVSAFMQMLIWYAMFAANRSIGIGNGYDLLFPGVILFGLLLTLYMKYRESAVSG